MLDGTPFLVEELMAGSLQGLLYDGDGLRREAMEWSLKLKLACDVARGMAHIHSLGHIHRDLKSGNVLVTATPTAKVGILFPRLHCLLCVPFVFARLCVDLKRATALKPKPARSTSYAAAILIVLNIATIVRHLPWHLRFSTFIGCGLWLHPAYPAAIGDRLG